MAYAFSIGTSSSYPPVPKNGSDARVGFGSGSSHERDQFLQSRLQGLLSDPIKYVGNEAEFKRLDSWDRIVAAPEPTNGTTQRHRTCNPELLHLRDALQSPVLTRDQEQYLFRKMNYLKFVANEVRGTLSAETPAPITIGRVNELLGESEQLRARLAEANLALVVFTGLRFFPRQPEQCVSIGSIGLMSAIDTFDYQKGAKFSTYAVRPITWEFQKYRKRMSQKSVRFQESMERHKDFNPADKSDPTPLRGLESPESRHQECIKRLLSVLTPREQFIIERRFGLNGAKREGLQQIGDDLHLTKERIRQIEQRAIQKLSDYASGDDAFF